MLLSCQGYLVRKGNIDMKWDITADPAAIKSTFKSHWKYYEQLHSQKFDNLKEINQFLKKQKPANMK